MVSLILPRSLDRKLYRLCMAIEVDNGLPMSEVEQRARRIGEDWIRTMKLQGWEFVRWDRPERLKETRPVAYISPKVIPIVPAKRRHGDPRPADPYDLSCVQAVPSVEESEIVVYKIWAFFQRPEYFMEILADA